MPVAATALPAVFAGEKTEKNLELTEMSTIPITAGRQFEIVTENEWRQIPGKKVKHTDIHQALAYLQREPIGTKVKIKCAGEEYRKKYAALKEAQDRRHLRLETKWHDNRLYIQRVND